MIGRRGLERVPNPGQATAVAPVKSKRRDAGRHAGPNRVVSSEHVARGEDVSHEEKHKTRRTARAWRAAFTTMECDNEEEK